MKTYFAKYLPIEGEIKRGDKFLAPNKKVYTATEDVVIENTGATKVKLFLCSRDVQVGDKVYWTDPEGITSGFNTAIEVNQDLIFMSEPHASETEAFPSEVVKVTGEVSEDATWVKEGDEFTEDEVQWGAEEFSWNHPVIVKIKGPCGHFH
jgi:hypothetical protein